MTEIENSKSALEPTCDLNDLTWPFYELVSTFQEEWPQCHLWLYLKTDHNDWGWKRNYYVMRSRDVKNEVTINHFRFEIPGNILRCFLGVHYRNRYFLGIHPTHTERRWLLKTWPTSVFDRSTDPLRPSTVNDLGRGVSEILRTFHDVKAFQRLPSRQVRFWF